MAAQKVKIAWYGKHFGEEPPLVGDESRGAGGVFFSGCNLRCAFCQNYQISQEGVGSEYSVEDLSKIVLDLQAQGAINIDLVTPTIWWKQIKEAILLARRQGLKIPIVWNSNAYENADILKEMRGLVDIYLPDFKYADDELAFKYSGIRKYSEVANKALAEMLSQVGNFNPDKNRGVIVRHLILPGNLENSFAVLKNLSKINKNIFISLMSQYFPVHRANEFPEINRPLTDKEFDLVYDKLLDLGFQNGWIQDKDSQQLLIPDFTKSNPFK